VITVRYLADRGHLVVETPALEHGSGTLRVEEGSADRSTWWALGEWTVSPGRAVHHVGTLPEIRRGVVNVEGRTPATIGF
jgi:hypothetical protein